ncbi:MAG: lipopolysaccharide biosynthesis protein [Firmicutes bacterium HGW-Firmicutes-12]|nr:MAG: lipopolysaccharide biosynthesis protein [Firmicutes bacterium HGW-Firmicutes-12]
MNQGMEVRESYDEIDLRQILHVIDKWKGMIALLTLVAIIIAGILSYFVLPPVYEAQTTLMVAQGDSNRITRYAEDDLESVIGSLSRLPEMTIRTYVEQIKDPILLNKVVTQLDMVKLGYSGEGLAGMIQTNVIKDTNLIEVKVQNIDSQLALDVAANLADSLLQTISESTQQQMSKSVEFLQEQIDKVSEELGLERTKLKELESRSRSVFYLEEEINSTISDLTKHRSSYQDISISYDRTKAGLEQMQSRIAGISETINGEENTVYSELEQQIAEKNFLLAEYKAQRDSTSRYIQELESKLNSLQIEITNKRNEIQQVERRVAELDKTYSLLTEKITQTQITKSVNLGETSLLIVSPATLKNSPVKPNKKQNMAIAAVLGLMISVALAFVLELLDNKIGSKEDIEKHLQLPVLGDIPRFSTIGSTNGSEEGE